MLAKLVGRFAASGLEARAAVADTWGAAHAAARFAGAPMVIVDEGAGREALAGLPVAALRLAPRTVMDLHVLGFRTIGEVASQPRAPLTQRFGPVLGRRLDQAIGNVPDPIEPVRSLDVVEVRRSFAEPIGAAEGERTKYTLQMIEDWETKGYRVAYGELREAYASFLASLSETDRSTAASMNQGRANLLANFARRMGEDPKKRDQIREVVYFFNRLGLCEGSGVCSHETTAVFFDDTVRTFVEVFQPYIDTHFASLPGSRTTVLDLSRRLDADR